MATFTAASIRKGRGGNSEGENMKQVIADKNYFFDAEGNVTTDESKGERWLAREGAAVLDEHVEALEAFQGKAGDSKVAPEEEAAAKATTEPKAAKASDNKKATPSKNKADK